MLGWKYYHNFAFDFLNVICFTIFLCFPSLFIFIFNDNQISSVTLGVEIAIGCHPETRTAYAVTAVAWSRSRCKATAQQPLPSGILWRPAAGLPSRTRFRLCQQKTSACYGGSSTARRHLAVRAFQTPEHFENSEKSGRLESDLVIRNMLEKT